MEFAAVQFAAVQFAAISNWFNAWVPAWLQNGAEHS